MPRRQRIYIPGIPYHIVQRGNNREACFFEAENYQYYLALWEELSQRYGVVVHAYCLMTNHIHFLATPQAEDSISRTMRVVGSRYAHYVNRAYRRSGSIWEGRHKSSMVQQERYLLACYRYIELNPVTAKMVQRPEEYQWSSYAANAWGEASWITPHEEYLRLGRSTPDCQRAYRALINQALPDADICLIRKACHYCQPTGDDKFRAAIEDKYAISLGQMKRGRPVKMVNF